MADNLQNSEHPDRCRRVDDGQKQISEDVAVPQLSELEEEVARDRRGVISPSPRMGTLSATWFTRAFRLTTSLVQTRPRGATARRHSF
jgi:hypothetical protein